MFLRVRGREEKREMERERGERKHNFVFNIVKIQNSSVLSERQGLVALWLLFLRPSCLLSCLLWPDDLRNASTPERKPEDIIQ